MFKDMSYIDKVDGAFFFIVAISAVLLIGITAVMIYFVVKYNRKRNPVAVNIPGNMKLEILWTVIPIILVMGMFWYGYVGYAEISNPPDGAMKVTVVGQMWKWTFKYENGLETDTLFVPVNTPVVLDLKSTDVNHSFYIPTFRFKRDVLPNKDNSIWFSSEQTGSFDIACAEYCGLNHWAMYTKVNVLPQTEYDAWLAERTELKNAANTVSVDTSAVK
ncbi:cytochrome c oxidase subunit II [uncultured bacterium]|nr:cytochrome c oxidase subunit II [uncultured bacterium]